MVMRNFNVFFCKFPDPAFCSQSWQDRAHSKIAYMFNYTGCSVLIYLSKFVENTNYNILNGILLIIAIFWNYKINYGTKSLAFQEGT